MTPADLASFLTSHRLADGKRMTRHALGTALEVSQDRLRRWLSGEQPIPRHIDLACAALAYGAPPWPWRAC
jgi:hypothetical protein